MSITNDRIDESASKTKGLVQDATDKLRDAGRSPAGPTVGGVVDAVTESVRDAAAGASRLIGRAEGSAQEWATSVGSAAVQAQGTARDVAAAAADNFGELGEDLTAFIRRHPLESLLIGAGVGVGVGFLAATVLARR